MKFMKMAFLWFIFIFTIPGFLNAIKPIGGWEEITCKITTNNDVGTGFVVEYKNYKFVITNKHVIRPGVSNIHLNMGKALRIAYEKLREMNIYLPFDTTKPIPIPVSPDDYSEHPDSLIDIAIVKLPPAGTYSFRYLTEEHLGNDSTIEIGSEIYYLGYPIGLSGYELTTPILKRGIVAGLRGEDKFYIDGNLFGGNSGGPVMHGNKLIGIVEGGYGLKINLDIGVAVKIDKIVETLDLYVDKLNKAE